MAAPTRIRWSVDRETRRPFGEASPHPDYFEAIGFPPPWDDRPWVFANMVASTNGVVAWTRRGPDDDPVATILGGDPTRVDRVADLLHMRLLRAVGDVAIGAETNRAQPDLVQTPQEAWERSRFPELQPVADALYAFRERRGLPRHPRNVIYSLLGRLDPGHPVFDTPGVEVLVVTTPAGARRLGSRGAAEHGVQLIVEERLDRDGLVRAHRRLFADHGIRYLDCEGGVTILRVLHAAGLLDEVFVTVTDVTIDEAAHDGVLRIFDFQRERATLIAEGSLGPGRGYTFRRWRFNHR